MKMTKHTLNRLLFVIVSEALISEHALCKYDLPSIRTMLYSISVILSDRLTLNY